MSTAHLAGLLREQARACLPSSPLTHALLLGAADDLEAGRGVRHRAGRRARRRPGLGAGAAPGRGAAPPGAHPRRPAPGAALPERGGAPRGRRRCGPTPRGCSASTASRCAPGSPPRLCRPTRSAAADRCGAGCRWRCSAPGPRACGCWRWAPAAGSTSARTASRTSWTGRCWATRARRCGWRPGGPGGPRPTWTGRWWSCTGPAATCTRWTWPPPTAGCTWARSCGPTTRRAGSGWRAALALAAAEPVAVQALSGPDFLARELAQPHPGALTVVWHSVVWQYVSPAERERGRAVLARAAAAATPDAPLALLTYEPVRAGAALRFELRLRLWPADPEVVLLGDGGGHGVPFTWA